MKMTLKRKYLRGKSYKTQRSSPTSTGGDAHLTKHRKHRKLNATQRKLLKPQPLRIMRVRKGRARMEVLA